MDRGNALQIYHLNLLKRWKEAVPAALTMVLQEREELGLEISQKSVAQFTSVPCGDHLSLSQRLQVAKL